MSFITGKRRRTDGNASGSDEADGKSGRHGGCPRSLCSDEERAEVRRLKKNARTQEQRSLSRSSEASGREKGCPRIYTTEVEIEQAVKLRREKQKARMQRLYSNRRASREVITPCRLFTIWS